MKDKILLWILISILLCSTAFAVTTTNLISYWAFDINEANPRDSHGANHWTNGGATFNGSNGILGAAYGFDANNDYMKINQVASLDLDQGFAISFWINPTDLENQVEILRQWDKIWDIQIRGDVVGDYVNFNALDSLAVACSASTTKNTWQHYVVTANLTTTRLIIYRNGVACYNNTDASMLPSAANDIFLGAFDDIGTGRFFGGMIDEMGVWNGSESLTYKDVEDLYNSGVGLAYPFTGAGTNFTIRAIDSQNSTTIISFNATFNGTEYQSNASGIIEIDILTNNTELWNISVYGAEGYFARNYYNYNISSEGALVAELDYFIIDNCTTYNTTTLNFTILNENTGALLNDSDMGIYLDITSPAFTGTQNYTFNYSVGNYYALCVPNITGSWIVNAQMAYSNLATYAEKNYYLVNYNLTQTETKINLYLTNGTTQTKLQVRDSVDDPVADVYIKVLSYDLETNTYKTTEIVKTDSEGDAYAQIIQNTEWYAFILELDEEIILQTLPTKITSSTLTLRVNLLSDYFSSYDVAQGITHDLTYNNNTRTFSFTWSDPTNTMTQACLELTRKSINGETQLNSSCQTSAAGTILLTIPAVVGRYTYTADSYAVINSQNFALQTLSVTFDDTYKTFGLSGVFFSMLLIITLVLVGLWHPAAAIVLMLVGVFVTNVLGIFYMNWAYVVTFIIIGVLTIYRTSRSE